MFRKLEKKKKKAEKARQFFRFWKLLVLSLHPPRIHYASIPWEFQSQLYVNKSDKNAVKNTVIHFTHLLYQTLCSIFMFLWLVDLKCWHWQQLTHREKKHHESRKKIGRAPQSVFKRFCLSVQLITGFHYLAEVN